MHNAAMSVQKDKSFEMFDRISPTYDRINRILSIGLDMRWRKNVAKHLPKRKNMRILDIATGTGDQIIALMEQSKEVAEAVGIDLAEEMINLGKKKIALKPYAKKVRFQKASGMKLPFPDNSFHFVSLSFGIRNMSDPKECLREIARVLKPDGRAAILEFSLPKNQLIKSGHLFYLRHVLPKIGALLSKDQEAYRYLNQTIESFPYGSVFCALMRDAGFSKTAVYPQMMGAVSLYTGEL
ncbi:MAG: bifunctional demethylmenaquinone methyltransferase/2-methoxy-6-polyprenyl-1,4-benzoquinol methylase UbiE [Chlamydiales bacterium]